MTEGGPAAAALSEFAAIVRDVGMMPGERDPDWWVGVRQAVCAAHGVEDFARTGTGVRTSERPLAAEAARGLSSPGAAPPASPARAGG